MGHISKNSGTLYVAGAVERRRLNTVDYVRSLTVPLAVVFLAAVLRLQTAAGFVGLDDSEYAKLAHDVLNGSFNPMHYGGPPVFPLRPGIIYPTAFFFKLFGINDLSLVTYPFLLSLLSVIVVYVTAQFLFGGAAGVISAFLWAVLPADIMYNATKLLPDLPGAFYASLASAILIYFTVADTGDKGFSFLFFIGTIAGLLFGFSWLCKSSVTFLLPFIMILFFYGIMRLGRRIVPLWTGATAGVLAVFVSETVVYWTMSGDVLHRFHEIERNFAIQKDGFFTEGSRWGWPEGGSYTKAVIKRILFTGPEWILLNPGFLYLPLVGLIASAYGYYYKDRTFYLPSLWLITLILMFNFSTTSFRYYAPLALFDRYLYPIFYPAVILSGGLLSRLLSGSTDRALLRERRFWGMVIMTMILFIASYNLFLLLRYHRGGWAPQARVISSILKPDNRVYTDSLSRRALEFYWGYPERTDIVDIEGIDSVKKIRSESYVLINKQAIGWLSRNPKMWLNNGPDFVEPSYAAKPPSSWQVVWKNDSAALYFVR